MEDVNHISWFSACGVRKNITDPLSVDVESDGGGFIVSEPVFGLFASCKDVEEGIEGIRTQFSMLWDAYVEWPESKLDVNAIKLREKLKALAECNCPSFN
jgi:hypothetical protein